jgi:hypothetical protein
MILSSTVYQTLVDLIRADKRGLTLSEDEYNRLSVVVNERVFAKKYKDFETSTSNIGLLAPLKVIDYPIVLGGAEASLPADYHDMIGKPRIVDDTAVTRRCDLVSQLELDERTDDFLTQPTQKRPVYTLGELDGSDNLILHVYPTTITGNITIDYLRTPNTPFLDYYMNDTTFERTYLDEDAVTPVNIPAGYTYRDGTTGGPLVTVVSNTVNWECNNDELSLILAIFASLVGISLPDELLIQAGNIEEQKSE